MTQLNFDASQVQPYQGRVAIPEDWYTVAITGSPAVQNKTKDGGFLELTLQVMEGPHAGAEIIDRLNIYHQNPVTVEIAYRKLSSYCHATGVIQLVDSQQLHGIPFKVKLGIEVDNSGKYPPSNKVNSVKSQKDFAEVGLKQPTQQGTAAQFIPPQQNTPARSGPGPVAGTFTPPNQAPAFVQQPQSQQPTQGTQGIVQAPASPTPPWAK